MIGFFLRRFRWMAVGAGVKYVARRGVGRSVDDAAAKIEERLPAPVARAANALPGDVVRASGAAVVSARAARHSVRAARHSARAAKSGGLVAARATKAGLQITAQASALRPGSAVTNRLRIARGAIVEQAEADERELRADFLRYTGDADGATNELLDLRDRRTAGSIPVVPEPVVRGRRRFVAAQPDPEVGRVQRSYRRPVKRWDRPTRGQPPARPVSDENSGEQGTLGR